MAHNIKFQIKVPVQQRTTKYSNTIIIIVRKTVLIDDVRSEKRALISSEAMGY